MPTPAESRQLPAGTVPAPQSPGSRRLSPARAEPLSGAIPSLRGKRSLLQPAAAGTARGLTSARSTSPLPLRRLGRSPAARESSAGAGGEAGKGLGAKGSPPLRWWVGVPQRPRVLLPPVSLQGAPCWFTVCRLGSYGATGAAARSCCVVWGGFMTAARAPHGDGGFGHRSPLLGAGGAEPSPRHAPRGETRTVLSTQTFI